MPKIKIALVTTIPTDAIPAIEAAKKINKETPNTIELYLRTGGDFRDFGKLDDFINFSKTAHVVIVHLMGDLPEMDKLVEELKKVKVPLMVSASFYGAKDYNKYSTVQIEERKKIFFYLNYGGKKNFENLMYFLANRFIGTDFSFEQPTKPVWEGIYHPDFDYIPTLAEYIIKKVRPDRLTVGLWFHQSHWQGGNTSFVDSTIREIEAQGVNVLPVFFSGSKNQKLGINGLEWVIDNYFIKNGKSLVEVVISLFSFSFITCLSGAEASVFLKKLDVPIIKAILTCNTAEEWRTSIQGLNIMDIPANIVMPEFDGTLITVPIAAMDCCQVNPSTGTRIIKYEPIPERVAKLGRLAINWGRLKFISNKEKKVAIIFHNYPPRNDTIGHAFGLDSSVSVMNILKGLKDQGYLLDGLPESSQELMDTIVNGLTNDRRWASSQELAEKALAKISSSQYSKWFNELPLDVREKIEKDWGKAPGVVFSYKGDLLIAGILNGNVYIGMQPPRGHLETTSSSLYHRPDLSPPHHYYCYYRWIRDVFKANVIMHIGTHGSLEWLPGKSVGLSASCFPDVNISDLPNIYPYVITDPGEGIEAKRRSYCCIIEHLVPVMHNADTYDELAKLEIQMQEYYHAKLVDQGKLSILQNLIWQNIVEAKLDQDFKISQKDAFADFDGFLERVHAYISELSDAQIRDGMHILGEAPTDLKLEEYLVNLTRLSNGSVPSLRQSIAELKGYDYEFLLANRGKLNSDGKTNGDILKEIGNQSLELIKKFHLTNFDLKRINEVALEVFGSNNPKIVQCLTYIATFLVPALAATTDELFNTLSGSSGIYVPSGPSGSITRGMADILPTGRNFFSIDPRAVPSCASWEVGVALGDVLLERYIKEEGKYPESVGIIVWATDVMKTKGDDVAEILYLMGVKPVWEKSNGRVVGLEVIPLETLKRPRIDVTLRISGMFRDSFPNTINLIDEAVALVASLDEPHERNFIAKHVETETSERILKGIDSEKAKEEAHYRIFGDRPGAYGCGVSEAIDSKNWKEQKDLSDIYVNWGSYAYTRKTFGCQVPELFSLRLSKINVTVKNQDSREYDILDGDDWYDAHGGMINAVRVIGGKAPKSYCGDSSDPERVKVRSTAEETCHVFRSRVLNPKYIEGMKNHGYQGAADMSRTFDTVFGWDATVEVVEDWMYEDLAKKYVLDKAMQEWLKNVNPHALQNMVERLLEAIQRNMWQAPDDIKDELQKLYLTVEGLLEESSGKTKTKERKNQ